MKYIVGIDPSQRHTGLCFMNRKDSSEPSLRFHEIKTDGLDVLSSKLKIYDDLHQWMNNLDKEFPIKKNVIFAVEKQLSVGGHTSPLLFYIQMSILEVIKERDSDPVLIMPLPIQLKSYMKRRHGVDITNATTIVRDFKMKNNFSGRISQHCVDGFYMALLGKDVFEGSHTYKLPSKEFRLTPWEIKNG